MSPELLAAASAPLHAVLRPAGPEAASIASLAGVLFAGGAVLFAAVLVLLAVALRGPRPVRAARWVLGGGVALPAVLLSALLAWSAARSRPLAAPTPPGALVVGITARMWWWELRCGSCWAATRRPAAFTSSRWPRSWRSSPCTS